MGIKGLHKFLKKNIPNVFEEIHISEYAYKYIGIDTSLYLYKYKSMNPYNWIFSFISLISLFRKNDIHCVFIFDNGYPPEKEKEREKRAHEKENLYKRIEDLENAAYVYRKTGELLPVLEKYINKRPDKLKTLIGNNIGNASVNNAGININMIDKEIEKMRSRIINVTNEDFNKVIKLFDILKVPYYNAIEEAENTCCKLCIDGDIDAVLSEDSDVLAYGTPVFLTKININTETFERIVYPNLLEELEFTHEQFQDFCIMCGTDYNDNIYKIGPEKSYKLIDTYKSIDNIKEHDISVLNHNRIREIFQTPKKPEDIKIKYCGKPDIDKLYEFVNYKFSIEFLKDMFKNPNIQIIE